MLPTGSRQQHCGCHFPGSVSLGWRHLPGGLGGRPVGQMLLFLQDGGCSAFWRSECDTQSTSGLVVQASQQPHPFHTLLTLPQVSFPPQTYTGTSVWCWAAILQVNHHDLILTCLVTGTCLWVRGLMVWHTSTRCSRPTQCSLSEFQTSTCLRCSGLQPDHWFLLQPLDKVHVMFLFGWFNRS